MADTALSGLDPTTALTSGDLLYVVDGGNSRKIDWDDVVAQLFTDMAELPAISDSIAATAADVFVYDTSRDSDGGAWRKRCQHTSWYNETLNTATRGARREFPAVALIVATTTTVTIYDADDPSLPMWHVEDYTGLTLQSVVAKDGLLTIGATTGLVLSKYLADDLGSTTLDYTTSTTPAIVNNDCNDVAITVLPDAPIDPATGLPVPTIAVATAGGVSVINNDGTVYSRAGSSNYVGVSFNSKNDLIYYETSGEDTVAFSRERNYTVSDFSDINQTFFTGSIDDIISDFAVGTSQKLVLIAPNGAPLASGSLWSDITSTYNTGWMPGDIKSAFLSDTDDTDLVGSGELVTNGDFATNDLTGWSNTSIGTGSANASTGAVRLQGTDSSNRAWIEQAITTTAGKTYVVSINVTVDNGGLVSLSAGTSSNNVNLLDNGTTAIGVLTQTFVASTTTTYIALRTTGVTDMTVDDVTVKLADEDRSVNNNGLIVNGTVTRNPVATGADLVAYSGFSASNYLEQAYNADLDFGTGDFAIIGWLKQAANTAVETILERDSAVSAQRFTLAVNASGFLTFTCDDDTTARTATSTSVVDNNVWTHFVAAYDGDGDVKIYLNGVLNDTETGSALLTLNNASAVLSVGLAVDGAEPLTNGSLALLRISATAPTADQIAKIYEDEKVLFQENAACTLYGASDAVTALAHDPMTNILSVGTSAGRSDFQGLRRVKNTTTAVGTAISASGGMIVEE